MHEVLINLLGGLSLPRKSVVRLTDRPDMTLDVYCGRKTTMQQQQQQHTSNETSQEKIRKEQQEQIKQKCRLGTPATKSLEGFNEITGGGAHK